jgi:hypothetical protein
MSLDVMLTARETFEPDRSRPSSHLVTGIVLRALAAHPGYRHSADTRRAADLLKSRFFRRDVYPDRAAPSNWLIFSYPFWWTDLLSALDSLAQLGFRAGDPDIARGVAWFTGNQEPGGCGIPGATGPRARTAICGWGSPSAGCSTPSARERRNAIIDLGMRVPQVPEQVGRCVMKLPFTCAASPTGRPLAPQSRPADDRQRRRQPRAGAMQARR